LNAAHYDYVQMLVETAIVGLACMAWFVVVLYRKGSSELRNWNRSWSRLLRVATLVGCTGILVHSLFDFNLQIPANAAMFFVFCALATSSEPETGQQNISRARRRHGSNVEIEV